VTDTIPAPAPEHDERCRHTDCVGECCEPCANMPKAEPATKQPDGMTERELEAWELQQANAEIYHLANYRPWSEQSLEHRERALRFRDRAEQLFKAKSQDQIASLEDFAGLVIEERDQYKATVTQADERVKRAEEQVKVYLDRYQGLTMERDIARRELVEVAYQRDGVRAEVARLTTELDTERAMKHGCQGRLLDLADGMKDLTNMPREEGEDTVAYVLRAFEWGKKCLEKMTDRVTELWNWKENLTKERDELVRKLEGAKAEGRRSVVETVLAEIDNLGGGLPVLAGIRRLRQRVQECRVQCGCCSAVGGWGCEQCSPPDRAGR